MKFKTIYMGAVLASVTLLAGSVRINDECSASFRPIPKLR